MAKFKLRKPIKDVLGENDITEITIKDEDDFSASDFYDVEIPNDGVFKLGAFAPGVANVTGLTESQVASLSMRDYAELAGIVGKHIM